MLFLLCLGHRAQSRKSVIDTEVDELILRHGVHAYEEASRRRSEAQDVFTERRVDAVKAELCRRLLDVCSDPGALEMLKSRLQAPAPSAPAKRNPAAEIRAELPRSVAEAEAAGIQVSKASAPVWPKPSLDTGAGWMGFAFRGSSQTLH